MDRISVFVRILQISINELDDTAYEYVCDEVEGLAKHG